MLLVIKMQLSSPDDEGADGRSSSLVLLGSDALMGFPLFAKMMSSMTL